MLLHDSWHRKASPAQPPCILYAQQCVLKLACVGLKSPGSFCPLLSGTKQMALAAHAVSCIAGMLAWPVLSMQPAGLGRVAAASQDLPLHSMACSLMSKVMLGQAC